MTFDVAGGWNDFIPEFQQTCHKAGVVWEFSLEEGVVRVEGYFEAADDDTSDYLKPQDVSLGSFPELDFHVQTSRQPKEKVNCKAAISEAMILFDELREGMEGSGYYVEFADSLDSQSMDITQSRDNTARTQSVESCESFEANALYHSSEVVLCSANGSTPSEAGLLLQNGNLLEVEQPLASDCSSFAVTPFASGTNEMEIHEDDSGTETHKEEFLVASEQSLLLVDGETWEAVLHKLRLLYGVHSPLPQMRTSVNVEPASCLINSSGNHEKEATQALENLLPIDWIREKDCILEKMLGKQTARTAPSPLHEDLLRIVQSYQNFGKNDVQTSRCFQRRITLMTNEYCVRHSRKVRYLPDFCKETLREWVQIDAHQKNPYPEKEELRRLANDLGLTPAQVEQWFENYRVRRWNPNQNGTRKGKFFRYPNETTALLKEWIVSHREKPNPRGKELDSLMEKTGMTSAQVKQWCYNFRRRHKDEML